MDGKRAAKKWKPVFREKAREIKGIWSLLRFLANRNRL